MNRFPLLNTGSVAQYPLQVATGQASQTIRFLDGTDQSYRIHGRMLRRWQVRLDLLNESELKGVEAFFEDQSAAYSTFIFPDPYSGNEIPNCRFGADALLTEYLATDIGATSFWVVETNA